MKTEIIAKEIKKDIIKGVYNAYPKLEKQLNYISEKLIRMGYMPQLSLSELEVRILQDNDYII